MDDQEAERQVALLKSHFHEQLVGVGGVVLEALRKELVALGCGGNAPQQNLLLEDPRMVRRVAELLLEFSRDPFRVPIQVPGYRWSSYVRDNRTELPGGFPYERYSLNSVPRAQRLTGHNRTVRLTFVSAMRPVTGEGAAALIRERKLRLAHPVEGFELAKVRPDLIRGPAPITILGRSLCLRQRRSIEPNPAAAYYLTLWGNADGLRSFLEPTEGRVYPDYALFLAAEP